MGSCVESSISERRAEQHILINEQEGSEKRIQTELTCHQVTLIQQEVKSVCDKIHLLEAMIAKVEPFTEASLQND